MRKQGSAGVVRRHSQSGLVKPVLLSALCGVIFIGGVYLSIAPVAIQPEEPGLQNDTATIKTFEVETKGIISGQTLGVAGQLRVNNTLVLNPSAQPAQTTPGQVYFDEDKKEIRYYDGSSYQGLASTSDVEEVRAQQPAVQPPVATAPQNITNVTQRYVTEQTINNYQTNGTVTEVANNVFTGSNSFADISVTDFAASGVAALQGSLTVSGNTLLGPTSASSLLLSSALGVSSGGTGRASFNSNEIVIGQGTGALSTIANGVPGLCLISTAGAPSFQACPGGTGSAGVNTLNGLNGDLTITNSSSAGSTITLDSASTTNRGIASFNASNFTVTGGQANTIQNIGVTAAPTFAGLSINGLVNGQTISSNANFTGTLSVGGVITANTISPNGSMVIGANGQNLTLQGSASTSLSATNGANTTTLGFGSPSANVTYRLQSAAAGTYDVCTSAGNCVGLGGSVTTAGGTPGALARFGSSQTLVDSILSESGSTISVNGSLSVNTITPTAAMSIGSAAQSLVLQGDGSTRLSAQLGGITNSLLFSAPSGSNKSIVLPNASGTVAVSASGPITIDANGNISCASCTTGGGGASGAVDSLNGINGAIVLNNSSADGSTITIDDASTSSKGIASFNSSNFSISNGAVNTVQDISVSSAPTFNALTLNTPLAVTSGGTGASTAAGARTNLGAASSGANTDITSLGGLSTALSISQGGTGATNAQSALNNISQLSAEGDLLYFDGSNSTRLARGISGQCLTSSTTSIAWSSCGPGEADTLATVTARGATTNTGVFLQGGATSRGLTIDTAGATDDRITVSVTGGGATSFTGQITAADLTSNRTWTLPNESGTFCLQGSTNCGFLTGSASNYIQNQNASQQATSNFWISGTGRADVALQAPSFDTASSTALNIGSTNASVLNLNQNTVLAASKSLVITGGATGTRPASPTEGMIYYDTTTKQLITYANGKWQADRSNSTVIVAANNSKNKDAADFVVSSADETAGNADAAIQAAIASLPASGGSVYLMEGTYTIDTQISLASNITISGAGRNVSIIKLKNAHNVSINMLNIYNGFTYFNNISIRDLTIDGNKANQTAGTQHGIHAYRMGNQTSSTVGLTVSNVYVKDMRNNGINLEQTANTKVFDSYFMTNTGTGIYVNSASARNSFTNNTSRENGGSGIDSESDYDVISDNFAQNNTLQGIDANGSDVKIANNTITNNASNGINSTEENATISGNTISSNTARGMVIDQNAKVTNNVIQANGSSGIYSQYLDIAATISGNAIRANTGSGIEFNRGGANTTITGNDIESNTVAGINIYGYLYQIETGIAITSNYIGNNATYGITFSSVAHSSITGNTLVNNGGATTNNAIRVANQYSGNINITGNSVTDSSCTTTCNAISLEAGRDILLSNNTIGDATLNDIGSNIYGQGEILDNATSTIYSNQRDGNGNLINRSSGALTVNTKTITSSLTIQGGMSNSQLPAPGQPSVARVGASGTTTYGYRVTALDGTGETLPSTERTITNANAVLDGTNYNTITWVEIPGAVQYKVYRTTSNGTPATTGLIGTLNGGTSITLNDTGLAAGAAVPGANTTGGASFAGGIQGTTANLSGSLTVAGASTLNGTLTATGTSLFKNTSNSTAAFQIQDSGSTALLTADTTNTKIIVHTLDISYNLTVAGHIITGGAAPTIAANTAACTSPTISVSGTDTAGTVTVTTGTGCASGGQIATVTFATAFGAAPKIVLTPASAAAASLNAYQDDAALTTSEFRIGVVNTPTDATTYKWHYYALQ